MKKIPVVADVETYINYFLVSFKRVDTGQVLFFERHEDSDTYIDIPKLLAVLRTFKIVTFNGRTYDMPMPMTVAALRGMNNAQLKAVSDRIITHNLKWWDIERELGIAVPDAWDHIDLTEPAPGVMIPLKLYGARMHSKRIQDLPVEPSAYLTDEQIATLRDYNINSDLPLTIDLWNALQPEIELREHMSEEYGIDLRSRSDAQIAEAVIKKRVTQLRQGQYIERADFDPDWEYKYKAPAFVKFQTTQLQEVVAKIEAMSFTLTPSGKPKMPTELASMKIKFGGGTYKIGKGGLHSTEKCQSIYTDAAGQLEDDDVASFYPKLILVCELFPPNMGRDFATVYEYILNGRLDAKAKGLEKIANSLKIVLNGTFGKLGSVYSIFYAPDLLLQVTITGQLILLMLIEALELAGIPVMSANTDGVISKTPPHLAGAKKQILADWSRQTGFATETTIYTSVHSRDVNNYFAIKAGVDKTAEAKKRFKGKGKFATTGLMKNPSNQICTDAVIAFLADGIPLRQTIESCKDVRKFINAQRVTGGAVWGTEYLGGVVRSYKSIFAVHKITYGSGKKEGHKVPDSDPVIPLMTLPDELPWDIDYDYYVSVAEKMLAALGVKIEPTRDVSLEWDESKDEVLQ